MNGDYSKHFIFTFEADGVTQAHKAIFEGMDGEAAVEDFTVLLFGAPANVTLKSITQ